MQFYNGEGPRTGSASGCAISYLVRHSLVASRQPIVIEQGMEMLRPAASTSRPRSPAAPFRKCSSEAAPFQWQLDAFSCDDSRNFTTPSIASPRFIGLSQIGGSAMFNIVANRLNWPVAKSGVASYSRKAFKTACKTCGSPKTNCFRLYY